MHGSQYVSHSTVAAARRTCILQAGKIRVSNSRKGAEAPIGTHDMHLNTEQSARRKNRERTSAALAKRLQQRQREPQLQARELQDLRRSTR